MELLEVNEKIEGFEQIDFDRREIRKGMRTIGTMIRRDARKKVARKVVSKPGEYPGKQSGKLQKSLTSTVSRPGFMVKIWPDPKKLDDDYYPAFLWYGVTGKSRRKDHKTQVKNGRYRIAPRANYMADTLKERETEVRKILLDALHNSLKIYP